MPIIVRTARYENQKLSHDTKTLFLHVPKTGGTFVERALAELRIGHWANTPIWVDRRHALAAHVKDQYDVRVVTLRHPADWHRSWCAFSRKSRPPEGVWHPLKPIWSYSASIDEYVDRIPHNFLGRLYQNFLAGRGELIVLKTDNLRNCLRRHLNSMGIDTTPIRDFPAQNIGYPEPLRPDIRQAIIDKEPHAMKLWEES